MDSPSPGSAATITHPAQPENTNPDLAEVLDARPAIPLQLITACPCLLHSPGRRGSHAPSPTLQRADTHTHHTLPCQPLSLPVPAEKQCRGLPLKALSGAALGIPCFPAAQ